MDVGKDMDGRSITYDETTHGFSIGGIPTTIDRIIAYDRGKQIEWASDAVREWALDFERLRREHEAQSKTEATEAESAETARRAQVAARARLIAPGYEPSKTLKLAAALKNTATALTVTFAVVGTFFGLAFGALLARWMPALLVALPLLFGAGSFFIGKLATFVFQVAAELLVSLVQIEMNTRPAQA